MDITKKKKKALIRGLASNGVVKSRVGETMPF
jgi:hypothetical protein